MSSLKQKKWAVIRNLSEIVTEGAGGKVFKGRLSDAILFLEAIDMIKRGKDYRGTSFAITKFGRDILKGHITRALLGETTMSGEDE